MLVQQFKRDVILETNICKNIEIELAKFAGKFRVYSVPNIMNITYGRGVGYKIEEEVLDEETQKISASGN